MHDDHPLYRRQAEHHFLEARRQARREQVRSWFSRRPGRTRMVPFDVVRAELADQDPNFQGVQQIPVNQILGSVGRPDDFNAHFLPLKDSLRERWVNVETYAMRHGWPPIDVYKVADAYFVIDGNHRVAVARQMGNDTIEARVYAFEDAPYPRPYESMDSWLIRLGQQSFMEQTHLDDLVPDHGIRFTTPGRYMQLLTYIRDFQRKLALIDGEEKPLADAVTAWYDMQYMPGVQIIRESGIMEAFPERTEADLFIWLSNNRHYLRQRYGEEPTALELLSQIAADKQEEDRRSVVAPVLKLLGVESAEPLPEIDDML